MSKARLKVQTPCQASKWLLRVQLELATSGRKRSPPPDWVFRKLTLPTVCFSGGLFLAETGMT